MKNNAVCLLTFLLMLITGCKTAEFKTQEKHFELMGNPTTGYTWIFVIGDESIINVEENVQYLGGDEVDGAPSLFMYTVRSLKPGKTSLNFEYKRPWESKAAEETKSYEVLVKKSGKINIYKKKIQAE